MSLRNIVLGLLTLSGVSVFADQNGGCTIAGTADAPLVIQEFVDFQCQYCKVGSESMQKILDNYPGQIQLVLRNLPLPPHGTVSLNAAKAIDAVCLQDPNLAATFQHELFSHQEQLKKEGDAFLF